MTNITIQTKYIRGKTRCVAYNMYITGGIVILYNANVVVKLGPKSYYTKNILICLIRLLSYIFIIPVIYIFMFLYSEIGPEGLYRTVY